MDDFINRGYRAMLLGERKEPFSDSDYIFELKLDGVRCLAYLADFTELRNKRNKDVTEIYPELSSLHECVRHRCVLDGELIILKDGKPDFFSLQKRALMGDPFKIRLESKKAQVQFVAYDILFYNGKDMTSKSQMERKKLLHSVVSEKNGLTLSRYFERDGELLYRLSEAENLEGIVAKHKAGKYHLGRRTNDWLKIKNMIDEDLIVCGYVLNEEAHLKDDDSDTKLKSNNKASLKAPLNNNTSPSKNNRAYLGDNRAPSNNYTAPSNNNTATSNNKTATSNNKTATSNNYTATSNNNAATSNNKTNTTQLISQRIKDLILGYYDDSGELKLRGGVSLGISKEDSAYIIEFAKNNTIKKPWFLGKKNVIWLRLQLVGTAHYMQKTASGNMRQAVWKGLRLDKSPSDCISE